MTAIRALEIGGTHATAALVDPARKAVDDRVRVTVDSHADAASILDAFADAARRVEPPDARWGIAIPDPFDYDRGVGRFHDVGKYESLDGIDVRGELATRIGADPATLTFINDADAFALGEAHLQGVDRLVGITLGTGVGSGWIADGEPVSDAPGVPTGGRIHTVTVDGLPLEDRVSSRAIRRAYTAATGDDVDVRDIAQRARDGDKVASATLRIAMRVLAKVLAPRLREFRTDLLVIGGAMAGSWDLLGPWFAEAAPDLPRIEVSADPEAAALLGAAVTALR